MEEKKKEYDIDQRMDELREEEERAKEYRKEKKKVTNNLYFSIKFGAVRLINKHLRSKFRWYVYFWGKYLLLKVRITTFKNKCFGTKINILICECVL